MGRELPEACLKRELREELREISAPSFLVENVSLLTFQYLWTAIEPVARIPEGFYQYRQIEVYELAFADPVAQNNNLAFIEGLFEFSHGSNGVKIVDYDIISNKKKTSDKSIAKITNYLISDQDQIPDAPLFGRTLPQTDADKYLLDFLRSGQSKYISQRQDISRPVLIHQVKKRYTPSLVARLVINKTFCVLKYYPNSNRYAQKEDWALRALRDTKCNIPELLDSDVKEECGPAFVLLQRINGVSLSEYSPKDRIEYLGPIVQQVLYLREIKFPTYGEIIGTYEPVANQQEIEVYVNEMVAHWQETLRAIPSRQKTIEGVSKLLNWVDSICAGKGESEVSSALTDVPCLCHSDLKPQDILIEINANGLVRPILLDFDNIFAFIPEYDLCKFHMYLIAQGMQISLEDFSIIIAEETKEKRDTASILQSLKATYPYVLTRLLHWAVPRNAGGTIDLVALISKGLDI